MNETHSIDARCILSFSLNEQLIVMILYFKKVFLFLTIHGNWKVEWLYKLINYMLSIVSNLDVSNLDFDESFQYIFR